ncbi:unnamed protein product [Eruca vesicaria subsp. sativa]|uniref:Coatomer subunit delta n=1 Tax=Eruca vesicaria subsp. sativa TaxID=29727 RepID=A0ABC8JJH8_ERUVS|nr:unnamed protein product [Eruca vesicaria subsp. sativa]
MTYKLSVFSLNDGFVDLFYLSYQVETGDNPEIRYETHPDFNGELFLSQRILGFLACPLCHEDGTLLWWRMQRANKSMSFSGLIKVSGNMTRVSITYDASCFFNLTNVIIFIPLLPPALRSVMTVIYCCSRSYESGNSVLKWKLPLINNSNRRGLLEFLVPQADSSEVFFRWCR